MTVTTHADGDKVKQLAEYGLSGVYFSRDNTRVYTYGEALVPGAGLHFDRRHGHFGTGKVLQFPAFGRERRNSVRHRHNRHTSARVRAIVYSPRAGRQRNYADHRFGDTALRGGGREKGLRLVGSKGRLLHSARPSGLSRCLRWQITLHTI